MGNSISTDWGHDAHGDDAQASFGPPGVCDSAGILGISRDGRDGHRRGKQSPARAALTRCCQQLEGINRAIALIRRDLDAYPQPVGVSHSCERPTIACCSPIVYAKHLYQARRARDPIFDDIFGEPAWDMMLDLFIGQSEQTLPSVSSLCIASSVPPTTALRWIVSMERRGLFERTADPFDRRRTYVRLTQDTYARMARYLETLLARDPLR